jgi:hypothetical protein
MRSTTFVDNDGKENTFALEPKMYVVEGAQAAWTEYAEKIKGHLAMIGFVSLLVMEVLNGHGIVSFINSL